MAESSDRVSRGGVGRKLRRQFLAGILISIPLGATIIILVWVFNTVDNLLQPLITYIWGHNIPGIGFGDLPHRRHRRQHTGEEADSLWRVPYRQGPDIPAALLHYQAHRGQFFRPGEDQFPAGGAGGVPPKRHEGHRLRHQRVDR